MSALSIKQPPSHRQPELFPDLIPDKPLVKPGEARTRYGKVVEEILTEMLGLTGIPNSGSHDVVFDAFHKPTNVFCEIKSLRRGSALPIYEWRRNKDRSAGVPLVYVIGLHNCTGQATLAGVWNRMAETLDTILVMPAAVIDRLAVLQPLRHLGKQGPKGERLGYRRAGYCEGYRNIPAKNLLEVEHHNPRVMSSVVRSLPCTADVYFHTSIVPWRS